MDSSRFLNMTPLENNMLWHNGVVYNFEVSEHMLSENPNRKFTWLTHVDFIAAIWFDGQDYNAEIHRKKEIRSYRKHAEMRSLINALCEEFPEDVL